MDNSYDEKELLERVSKGEELAFSTLYDRYWNRVYTMAIMYIKSPQAAQDIVQDVFVKIWMNRESLQRVREFKAYLFVTARNYIISTLRNKVFHEYLNDDEQLEEKIFLPESQLSFKESVSLLHKAIEMLPPQQQKAYKLSRNEGMSYEQIAQEMGISRLTVRTHITKALSFIRKSLTGNTIPPVVLPIALFWNIS